MKSIVIFFATIAILMNFSCSSEEEAAAAATAIDLTGTWAKCESKGTYDQKEVATISETALNVKEQKYTSTTDGTCGDTYTVTMEVAGTYTIGNTITEISGKTGVKEIDETLTTLITGTGFTLPINIYDIYKIEGTTALFGKDNLSCGDPCQDKAKRSTELVSAANGFTKQ